MLTRYQEHSRRNNEIKEEQVIREWHSGACRISRKCPYKVHDHYKCKIHNRYMHDWESECRKCIEEKVVAVLIRKIGGVWNEGTIKEIIRQSRIKI